MAAEPLHRGTTLATVLVPTMLQTMAQGVKQLEIPAVNVRQVIDRLEELYLGIKARLMEGGQIRPTLRWPLTGR